MEHLDGQLHRQRPRGYSNSLVNSPRDLRCVDVPSITQTSVDLSPLVPPTGLYSRASSTQGLPSSSEDDDLPPYRRPSSEEDDLPPPSTRFRKKAISRSLSVRRARSPSPPSGRSQLVQRDDEYIFKFHKLLWEIELDANQKYQLFVLPSEMQFSWDNEAEAHRQIYNAETNQHWIPDKPDFVLPQNPRENVHGFNGDGIDDGKGLFSVYTYKLVANQILKSQLVIEKSQEVAVVNRNYEKIHDKAKMWAIGCDFAIFSRSERLGLQDTPIVPFNLNGTSVAAKNFIFAEPMMRKLAYLELCSIFELPVAATSSDLAKIAYAFYKGEEVPEDVNSLPNSPYAIPKEFRIDEDGRSDRAKVIAQQPVRDEKLQLFLQDVMISNHLENVYTEKRSTMCGNLRVHRHSSYADVKEKLKVHERNVGKDEIQQAPEDCEQRQVLRNNAWWSNYMAIIAKAEQEYAKVEKALDDAEFSMREVTGLVLNGNYNLSQDDADGETTTEVGEEDANIPMGDSNHAPADVGEGLGSNAQATESQSAPAENNSAAESKKSKGKGKNKDRKTLAGSGGENTPVAESSTILQPSASDATATNTSEVETTPEAAANVATLRPSSEVIGEVSSSAALSPVQPTTAVSNLAPAAGKSKKKKNKKKKGQDTQATNDTASASGKIIEIQTSKSNSGSVSQDQFTHQDASSAGQSVKKPNEAPAQEPTTSGAVLSLDALGVRLPVDSEDGAWKTVKSRAPPKSKVNVSTATKGGLKSFSRAALGQPQPQQLPRGINPRLKSGPPSKTAPVPTPVVPPKDVRIYDPDEYPAMPTPTVEKNKAQGKNIRDSKPASVPELATCVKKIVPVTPHVIPKVASGTVTPTLEPLNNSAVEIDSDPEDLYGASPPRKTRTTVVSGVVNQASGPAKGSDNPSTTTQGGVESTLPEAGVHNSTSAVKVDSTRALNPESAVPIKNKDSISSAKDSALGSQVDNKPTVSESTATASTEKNTIDCKTDIVVSKVDLKTSADDLKGKGKKSSTDTTANANSGPVEAMTANDSNAKSNVKSAAKGLSSQPKGKEKVEVKLGAKAQAFDTATLSTRPGGAESTSVDHKNKKKTHKLKHPKGKSSSSGGASEKSTAPNVESKKPAVSDTGVALSTDTEGQDAIQEGIPPDEKPENIVQGTVAASEVKPASEHIPIQELPAEKSEVKNTKTKVAPVPADLAWADLVSPTKPGSLKKRRCSVDHARDDDDPDYFLSPFRRSSISAARAIGQRVFQFGQLPALAASSTATGDDPFVTVEHEKGTESQQKDPDVSFASSATDEVEQRDSRASPEVDVTPRTDLMLTPASPESYNGEPYINKDGNVVTLFRRDAEISNFPGQKHLRRPDFGPAHGNQSAATASNPTQGRSSVQSSQIGVNTGEGSHSHPPSNASARSQTTGCVAHQGGQQGSTSTSPLGSELKAPGQENGTQGGMAPQGLSPIPEASISSEVEPDEETGHNPPTNCTFCEKTSVPTAANPFHFCPLCGVTPGHPYYCSKACLLANAWDHSRVCNHTPAYVSNTNTNFGPTYRMEAFSLNNLYFLPDSPEKYRQKMFTMFCKYGAVPDIRAAHVKKWPSVDWTRILPSPQNSSVGDYHIFKSQASHTGGILSRANVICSVRFPLEDGSGYKLMITRALNIALVTNDASVLQFLYSVLRSLLMDPRYFNSFHATEPHDVVMTEFKAQFFKEFGMLYADSEPIVDARFAFQQVQQTILGFEARYGILQFWLNAALAGGRMFT